ncbi:hypothetical protein SUGI_0572950 [Cryptomeria japonica]|nr:hypothetical protein SUGI_0572950 [Cryptomeria japonica]
MEQAIADGIDILSISIHSDDMSFHMNYIAIIAFGAIEKGVFVLVIADNQGCYLSTLSHMMSWITIMREKSTETSLLLWCWETKRYTEAPPTSKEEMENCKGHTLSPIYFPVVAQSIL